MFGRRAAPRVKSSDTIYAYLKRGIKEGASDIHWEPYYDGNRESVVIRFRVDGILKDAGKISSDAFSSTIINAIKIMSSIDPTKKRTNQDGRFNFTQDGTGYDVRVAIMPTISGEKVVMRITNRGTYCKNISELGMSGEALKNFELMIHRPEGFVLITGPSGAGKTTTLYSILQNVYRREINICTIEDPVELQFAGINQIQVNYEYGMTFVTGLRAIMRQDPNIVAVGEIRDLETVRIAFQASLAGSMVFSTLHARDAVNTVTRLMDMGVEPFFIATALTGIVSQRLIRLTCRDCAGQGCKQCNFTGFRKRIGVFEVLRMTDPLRQLILKRPNFEELKAAAIGQGMVPFASLIEPMIKQGLTTAEEVNRVLALE